MVLNYKKIKLRFHEYFLILYLAISGFAAFFLTFGVVLNGQVVGTFLKVINIKSLFWGVLKILLEVVNYMVNILILKPLIFSFLFVFLLLILIVYYNNSELSLKQLGFKIIIFFCLIGSIWFLISFFNLFYNYETKLHHFISNNLILKSNFGFYYPNFNVDFNNLHYFEDSAERFELSFKTVSLDVLHNNKNSVFLSFCFLLFNTNYFLYLVFRDEIIKKKKIFFFMAIFFIFNSISCHFFGFLFITFLEGYNYCITEYAKSDFLIQEIRIFIENKKSFNESVETTKLDGVLLFLLSIIICIILFYRPKSDMPPVLSGSVSFENENNSSTMVALHLDKDIVSFLEKYGVVSLTVHEEHYSKLGGLATYIFFDADGDIIAVETLVRPIGEVYYMTLKSFWESFTSYDDVIKVYEKLQNSLSSNFIYQTFFNRKR